MLVKCIEVTFRLKSLWLLSFAVVYYAVMPGRMVKYLFSVQLRKNHENFSHDRRLLDRRIGHFPDANLGRYRYLTLLGLCNYVSCMVTVCK